ncbi:MAG: nucleotidyltransferase domain-containing protein [Gammaproteobacteria bacterium]
MKTLDEIALKPTDRLAIEAAARTIRAQVPVAELILFGSKAEGRDDAESDIDLLVLTTREISWHERGALMGSLYPIQLEYDVVISPLVVPVKEWQQGLYSVLPLHDEIEGHGIAA